MTITEAHERAVAESLHARTMAAAAATEKANDLITAYLATMEVEGFVWMPTAITQEMREAVRKNGGDGAVGWANAIYPDLIAARPRVTP